MVPAERPFSLPSAGLACADLRELADSSEVLTLHASLVEQPRHLPGEPLRALCHPPFDHPDASLPPRPMGMTCRAMTLTLVDAARGVADVLVGRPLAAVANPDRNLRKASA